MQRSAISQTTVLSRSRGSLKTVAPNGTHRHHDGARTGLLRGRKERLHKIRRIDCVRVRPDQPFRAWGGLLCYQIQRTGLQAAGVFDKTEAWLTFHGSCHQGAGSIRASSIGHDDLKLPDGLP